MFCLKIYVKALRYSSHIVTTEVYNGYFIK